MAQEKPLGMARIRMTREGQHSERERETASPQEGAGTWASSDYSFTLQAVMEMKQSIGELTQAVRTLNDTTKAHGDKLDKISHRLYAASAVIVVLTGIAVFVLDKIWDTLVAALKMAGSG